MKFQIKDNVTRNIVDKNLSYEQALFWIDNEVVGRYIMEPMKEEDQNGSDTMRFLERRSRLL